MTAVNPEAWFTVAKPPELTAVKPEDDTGLGRAWDGVGES